MLSSRNGPTLWREIPKKEMSDENGNYPYVAAVATWTPGRLLNVDHSQFASKSLLSYNHLAWLQSLTFQKLWSPRWCKGKCWWTLTWRRSRVRPNILKIFLIRNLKRMMVFSTREQPRPQQSCQQGRANWSGRPNKHKFEYLDIFQIICNRIILLIWITRQRGIKHCNL